MTGAMTTAQDFARDCLRWAERCRDKSQREALLGLARLWIKTALETERSIGLIDEFENTVSNARRALSDARAWTEPKPSQLTKQRRKEAGAWLRKLREQRGLSQRELARAVGAEVYTLISQLEHGRGFITQDRYHLWADALGIELPEFARTLTSYYSAKT